PGTDLHHGRAAEYAGSHAVPGHDGRHEPLAFRARAPGMSRGRGGRSFWQFEFHCGPWTQRPDPIAGFRWGLRHCVPSTPVRRSLGACQAEAARECFLRNQPRKRRWPWLAQASRPAARRSGGGYHHPGCAALRRRRGGVSGVRTSGDRSGRYPSEHGLAAARFRKSRIYARADRTRIAGNSRVRQGRFLDEIVSCGADALARDSGGVLMATQAIATYSRLTVEFHPPVARISLNHPSLNVIDVLMMEELLQAITEVESRKDVSVLVLTGQGKAFSVGVDVGAHTPDKVEGMLGKFHGVIRALIASTKVTIGVVHGHCLGGGAELAMICDVVYTTESALWGFPEIKLGCYPPVAVTALAAIVGQKQAADLILTG